MAASPRQAAARTRRASAPDLLHTGTAPFEAASGRAPSRPDAGDPASQEELGRFLAAAEAEAERRGEAVVASWVVRVPVRNPLELFARAGGEIRLFWSDLPSGTDESRITLVGSGAAAHLLGRGGARFRSIREARGDLAHRTLTGGPVVRGTGPILVGGFAFAPASGSGGAGGSVAALRPGAPAEAGTPAPGAATGDPEWAVFPDGLLILPEVMVTSAGGSAWLTLNAWVEPGDPARERAAFLARRAAALLGPEARRDGGEARDRGLAGGRGEMPRAAAPGGEAFPGDERAPREWREAVASAARAVRQGRVRKVVLARPLRVRREGGLDGAPVLAALAASHPQAALFALDLKGATFLGATPERLARVEGGWVESMALAGSAPRAAAPAEDERLGRRLLHSRKNREEHQVVVDALREGLASLTESLEVPPTPELLRLPTVQHLLTPLRGRLVPGADLLDVVERLHPTPAVGGSPREEALRLARELEGWDRGWYAGPFGWVDPAGEGAFVVSIRSGLLKGGEALLFAGCGIVGASEPEEEYREWRLKLRPLVEALEEAAP